MTAYRLSQWHDDDIRARCKLHPLEAAAESGWLSPAQAKKRGLVPDSADAPNGPSEYVELPCPLRHPVWGVATRVCVVAPPGLRGSMQRATAANRGTPSMSALHGTDAVPPGDIQLLWLRLVQSCQQYETMVAAGIPAPALASRVELMTSRYEELVWNPRVEDPVTGDERQPLNGLAVRLEAASAALRLALLQSMSIACEPVEVQEPVVSLDELLGGEREAFTDHLRAGRLVAF